MQPDEHGDWILATDYAALEVQCEKYKKEALITFDCQVCSGALEAENDRLRADCRWAMEQVAHSRIMLDASFESDPDYQRAVTWLKENPR
jgi:hypothetical protein